MRLLEEAGTCFVPGSGFGQKPGTYYFRVTIHQPLDVFNEMLSGFALFHARFMAEFADD